MKLLYQRTEGARVSDDLFVKDMRLVVMENDALRVSVLVDKGADIVEFLDKRTGVDVMWRSPNGFRSIKSEPNLLGPEYTHRAYHEGGWQELFPHGSLPRTIGEGPTAVRQPMHGEVLALPWKYAILEDRADSVIVRFWTHTVLTRFRLERVMRINAKDPVVHFAETVVNEGSRPFDFLWGHHPTFGTPFLTKGCKIDLPKGKFVDGDKSMLTMFGPETRAHNMLYLTGFDDGRYGIYNPKLKLGFGMKWDAEIFKVIWIWEISDGDRYACALEPATSFPEGHEDIVGRVKCKPGEVVETEFEAFLYK